MLIYLIEMEIWRKGQRGSGRLGRDSQSSPGFHTVWTNLPQLSTFLILILLAVIVMDRGVDGWESDVENFVSFRDVMEWAKLYKQCDIGYDYQANSNVQRIEPGQIPFTLSPIPLPASDKALKPIKLNDNTDPRVLYIYTTNPPDLADYTLSYGFQKGKVCLVDDAFNPCNIRRSFGSVRGVVLSAVRESLLHIKNTFDTEDPEKFVTIVNGETNEKKFHEAIFMGHAKGSNGSRSTHTVDGKSYPMEIYMFFADETLEAMAAATVLVVLVEESEEDNPNVLPLINAINYHAFNAERKWLKDHEVEIQREHMYHHMRPSRGIFPTFDSEDEDNKVNKSFYMEASWELEQKNADYQDSFEKLLTLESRLKFYREEIFFMQRIVHDTNVSTNKYINSVNKTTVEFVWLLDCIKRLVESSNSPETDFENIIPEKELTNPERKEAWMELLEFHEQQNKLFEDRINKDEDALEHIVRIRKDKKVMDDLLSKVREAIIKSQFPNATVSNSSKESDVTVKGLLRFYFQQLHIRDVLERIVTVQRIIDQSIIGTGYENNKDQADQFEHMKDQFERLMRWEVGFNETPHPVMKMKARKIQNLTLGNMEMMKNQSTFAEKEHVIIPLRNQFQISWLIPDGGGYYLYKGSSPVPPCFQTARTIVFKKPIKMSFDQIQVLTTVPTHFDKHRNIQNTLGRLHKLRRENFSIYFEKRNHQFLGSDGVHKNSVLEAAKRRQAGCGICRINYYLLLLTLLLLTLRF